MGFVFFGVGFGLFFGLGLYFLILRPALKERNEAEAAARLNATEKPDHESQD